MIQGVKQKQLSTYLPEDTYTAMAALAGEDESITAYIRTAVEAENRRRLFAGMDDAIAAVVDRDAESAWHSANAAFVEPRGDAAQG